MYNYIINPKTGRKVSIYGKVGKSIITKYHSQKDAGGSIGCTAIDLNYPQGKRTIYFPSDNKFKKCSVIKRVMKGGIWEQRITKQIYNDLAELKKKNLNTIAIDIGANIGAHTISMLDGVSQGGFVIAFEPQIEIANCLENTLAKISSNNFIISTNLVSNKNSISNFVSNGTGRSRIPLKNNHYNKDWSHKNVKTTTLDKFLLDHPTNNLKVSLIKIDVEGHEFEVLEGASNTIKKNKPIIYIEVWKDKGDYIKLKNWCSKNNYSYQSISPNDYKLLPNDY